ncbi:MAG: head-tail adaptor protein [Pseudomonadota bacterium]
MSRNAPVLNRKLKLETAYRTRDDMGGYTEIWQVLGELWAQVKAGTGREIEVEGITVSSVPLKITVRATPYGAPSRPAPGQRFREGDRTFRILTVTEADAAARYLTCVAVEEEVTS